MTIGPSDYQTVRLSDRRTTSNRLSDNSYTVASVPLSCINECLILINYIPYKYYFINLISVIFVLTVNLYHFYFAVFYRK